MKLWHWIAIVAVVAVIAFFVGRSKYKIIGGCNGDCGDKKEDLATEAVSNGKKSIKDKNA